MPVGSHRNAWAFEALCFVKRFTWVQSEGSDTDVFIVLTGMLCYKTSENFNKKKKGIDDAFARPPQILYTTATVTVIVDAWTSHSLFVDQKQSKSNSLHVVITTF